jgi:lactoylglutathione lyase
MMKNMLSLYSPKYAPKCALFALGATTLACSLASAPAFAQGEPTAPQRPRITGISHIAFYVSNLPKAVSYWHDFLGFQQYFQLPKKDSAETRIAFIKVNDHQHIELFNEAPVAPPSMLAHICFSTDNVEQMRAYLRSQGIDVKDGGGKTKAGDYAFMVKDPDGMLVEFVQSLPDGDEMKSAGKFMSPEAVSSQIYHVGFLVGNSARSMDFYGRMLGFQETWRGSSTGKELSWINMRVPDGKDYVEFMLYRPPVDKKMAGTKNHVALEVADAQGVLATLRNRPAFKDYGRSLELSIGKNGKRIVNLYDPDGSRAEVMEPNTVNGTPVPSSSAPLPPDVHE